MMKKFFSGALALLTCLALGSSCSIYHPHAVEMPMISQKGEVHADGAVAMSGWLLPDVMTINTSVSYGLTDLIALQGHANYGGENAYGQLAAGVYKQTASHFLLEGYLGYGYGGAWREKDEDHNYEYSGNYHLPFVQFDCGFIDLGKPHFDVGLGLKGGLFFPDFEYHKYDSDGAEIPADYEHFTTMNYLLEPMLQMRIGSEKVKFRLGLGLGFLDNVSEASKFTYDFYTLSAGATLFFR